MTSYSSLLRTNRNFRLLFLGQTISQLGDWFNAVAVYALLLDLTGSATAVALMLITQYLPVAVVGPLAGVVVDRVNRRRLMIVADVVRGVLILGLLLVRSAGTVWIAYVVTALTMSASCILRAGAHGDDSQHHLARGIAAGQCAVGRDVVGHARGRRLDRRLGHGRRG